MTTTPTLGLTQFEATDTINFLTQYNTDLSKIDTNAKMTKAIGSDYIYSYTTAPSYTGGTVTLYAGTKFVCADGRDANGDIKQTIYTLSTNKTLALTGTGDYNIYIDSGGNLVSALMVTNGMVNFVSELPSTVPNAEPYRYYVFNEHRYYYTFGSTTASWSARAYCKVASVRVASSAITYFKPNLQLNLAQKIGKDKLLMTMAEVNANTDKEFVPSAVAVKELGSYSNAETVIGTWTDGKKIYRKVVDTGSLPNTASKFINHNINNLETIMSFKGVATNSTNGYRIPLPYLEVANLNYCVQLFLTSTNIQITTGDNKSNYNSSFVVIEYTKSEPVG